MIRIDRNAEPVVVVVFGGGKKWGTTGPCCQTFEWGRRGDWAFNPEDGKEHEASCPVHGVEAS